MFVLLVITKNFFSLFFARDKVLLYICSHISSSWPCHAQVVLWHISVFWTLYFHYVCYFNRDELTALAAELNPVDLGLVSHCCVYSNVYIGQAQYYICMNIMKEKRKEA